MNGPIKSKLSIMMFLEFFIWGCWFVTMGFFLSQAFSASDANIGLAYSTQSWGAIISPFIIGLIADRYFNAEKVLAIIHIIVPRLCALHYYHRDCYVSISDDQRNLIY